MELLASIEAFLVIERLFKSAAKTEAAPEAENSNVGTDASDAGESVDDDVADFTSAAKHGNLMDFVDGAINGGDDDWIEY